MEKSAKELRIQPGKIIDQVVNTEDVTVTFRGKALVKIVPFNKEIESTDRDEISIFGLCKDFNQKDFVEDVVRNSRIGRQF